MRAQHLSQLAEDALSLVDLFVGAFDDDLVAPSDELLSAERGADFLEVVVATAEQKDSLFAAVQSDRRFAHPFPR